MVRPSIHASGRGRARASAPTERTKSLSSPESFFCPCTSMGGQKSIASTCTAGWRLRTANVTSNVPAARSRTRFPSACPGSTASARHFRQPWSKPRLKSLFNGSYHLTIRAKSPETFAAWSPFRFFLQVVLESFQRSLVSSCVALSSSVSRTIL